MITKGLRTWFVIHFIIDMVLAVPLLAAPQAFLSFWGWTIVDPYTARLVGAALAGIGFESYLGRHAGIEAFQGMLNLKIIWSATAIAGILLTMASGFRPWGAWLFLGAFIIFNTVWVYYRRQLRGNS